MDEVKRIPLNAIHEKLGAKMVPFAGFNMPVRYSSDIEEHMAVRENVGVFDVSHMGEFTLKGLQVTMRANWLTDKLNILACLMIKEE